MVGVAFLIWDLQVLESLKLHLLPHLIISAKTTAKSIEKNSQRKYCLHKEVLSDQLYILGQRNSEWRIHETG